MLSDVVTPTHVLNFDDITELRHELLAVLERMEASIKERIDKVDVSNIERVNVLKDSVALALAASDKAVTKQEDATTRRFDDIDKYRMSQDEARRLMMPRSESEVVTSVMNKSIQALESRLDKSEGKGSGSNLTIVYMAMIVSALVSIASLAVAIIK